MTEREAEELIGQRTGTGSTIRALYTSGDEVYVGVKEGGWRRLYRVGPRGGVSTVLSFSPEIAPVVGRFLR